MRLHITWLCVVATGCALDSTSEVEAVQGGQESKRRWHHASDGVLPRTPTGFPVNLGEQTPSTIDFSVSPSWECRPDDVAPVTTIYVCETEGQGDAEKRIRRCYSIAPNSQNIDADPYLSCATTPESDQYQCKQHILSNGRYHVGAVYSSTDCGTYEFWWSGIEFKDRDLSVLLVPLNEKRHLDHRLIASIASPDVVGDERWLKEYETLRLDFEIEAGLPQGVRTLLIQGPGIRSVAYDTSLGEDAAEPRCVEIADLEFPTWSCPLGIGAPLVIEIDLRHSAWEREQFLIDVELGFYYPLPQPPESRVTFSGIDLHETLNLPIIVN